MSFEKTTQILANIPDVLGAMVVNFETKQLLAQPVGDLPSDLVAVCSDTIRCKKNVVCDMQCIDVVEAIITTTNTCYLAYYLVPQFDNVLIFVVTPRKTSLALILRTMEQAGFAMSSR